MFDSEYLGVEVGDPLLAFLGHPQITESVLDTRAYHVPVEFRIVAAHIPGVFVAYFFI